MKRSLAVNALNVLIVIAVIAALAALGAILLTVVQSAPSVTVGSVTSTTSGTVTQIRVPISLSDKGYLAFSNIGVQLAVKDSSGDQLISAVVGPVSVAPGETTPIVANLSLDTSKLSSAVVQDLATTSQNLTLTSTLTGGVPPFVAFTGTVSAELPWGAPVSNLVVGTPSFAPLNSTAVDVTVPVSFHNTNDYLAISGTGTIAVLDSSGKHVGGGTVQVSAPPNSQFSRSVNLTVGIPVSQIESLLFNDQNLSYSAELNFQSGGQTVFTTTKQITYGWKAPLSGLQVGSPVFAPYNSTDLQVTLPVSFTNRNDQVDISTDLKAAIFNASSGTQLGSGSMNVSAPHGSSFSGNLVGYVRFTPPTLSVLALNDRTISLDATLTGTYSGVPFTFSRAVSLNWQAPLKNLTFGPLNVSVYNSTYAMFSTTISFVDGSSSIPVSGTIGGVLLGSSNSQVGSITTLSATVSPGQTYSATLSGYVALSAATQKTFVLDLTFSTSFGSVTEMVTVSA